MQYNVTMADNNETAIEIMEPLQLLYVASKINEATRCPVAMPQHWRSAYGPTPCSTMKSAMHGKTHEK